MRFSIRYFFRTYWKDYFWGILFLLITNLLAVSIPLLIKRIIDGVAQGQIQTAFVLTACIGAVIVVMFFVRVASRYFLIGVGRKIELETRMQLFRHLLSLPRSFYDVQQTGDLMSRLTNDLSALRMFLGGGMMLLINVVFAYITVVPVMAFLSWRLMLLSFALYPVVIGLMRVLSLKVKHLSFQVQERLGDLTAVAQENFSGIGVIQSYAKEAEESARFRDASTAYLNANTFLVKTRALLYILIAMVSGISMLVVLGEGGREVILKEISLSSFAAFMLYLERLAWPTVSMGWTLSSLQQGFASKERINQIFQAEPTITDQAANFQLDTLPLGPVEIRNLWFKYDNPYETGPSDTQQDKSWVLKDVSLTVQPGETVALVGPIGAGKTTLLNLLVRLYEPSENSIFINRIPLQQLPLQVLRQGMTLMPQNCFLFSTTLQENIAYVEPEHPIDTVESMARMTQVHDEILQLPQAYQTIVGERGITLSGGQRQRTALARTLLVAPQVLLLDDPFSNVDVETEEAIIQALHERQILQNRITIFASQRFSLVRKADRIMVLNASGEVDAIGTHEDLMACSALYRDLSKLDANRLSEEEVSLP